jgi:hypothetical protein
MLRGFLVAALAAVALAGLPAAAYADGSDPIIDMSVPDGWAYPQGQDVTFGFLCRSPVSAIVSCEGSQPFGSKLDTFQAGYHTVSVTATDYEGRQTTASATYFVLDVTKPHVIFRIPSEGATYEQGSTVRADYACADNPGGIGILDNVCFGPVRVGTPLDTSHSGNFSFQVTALDRQNNLDQETVHYSVADRTPPTVSFFVPNPGTYTLGDQVFASYSCDDFPGSGVSACKGDVPNGAPIDTSTVGTHTFAVTAYDRAGNVARRTQTYSVLYDFYGFASPAFAWPTQNVMKAGENVPLKFSLRGDQGSNIFAAGSPAWAPCGALDQPTPADGTLSYNASTDRYMFLAASSKSWVGTCYELSMTLNDSTTHRARFSFTK